jgi:hypothetical protein
MSFLQRLNPKRRRGEASKLWLMTETAPFQVPLLAYFFITGLIQLSSNLGLTPRSVDSIYPTWLILAWALSTTLGAGLALLGRYLQTFRLEAAGLGFILSGCAIYTTAVLWVNGFGGTFTALGFVAIGSGCAIRMRVIARHHKAQKVAGEIIQSNGDSPS